MASETSPPRRLRRSRQASAWMVRALLGLVVLVTASVVPTQVGHTDPSQAGAWSASVNFDEGLRRWVTNPMSDFSTFYSNSVGGQNVAKMVARPTGGTTIEVRTLISTLARTSRPGEEIVASTRVRTHQDSRVTIELNEGRYEGSTPASMKASTGHAFAVKANQWTTVNVTHHARGNLPVTVRIKIDDPRVGDELQVSRVDLRGSTPTASGQPSTPPTPSPTTVAPPTPPPVPVPVPANCAQGIRTSADCRVLTWSDEFNDGSIDRSKWSVRDQTTVGYDNARILAGNASETNGILRLQARRDQVGDRPYSTAYLDTIGHFSQQYGRWEMRAKLPTVPGSSRGVWPAFWLRNDQGAGESDIMEAYGGPTDQPSFRSDSYTWTIHEDTNKQLSQKTLTGYGTPTSAAPVSDAYHVYAMAWTPEAMKFYFDGVLVGTAKASDVDWFAKTFNSPMNIRLNLQIGSKWAGFPDPAKPDLTKMPANFDVDYIRVYK